MQCKDIMVCNITCISCIPFRSNDVSDKLRGIEEHYGVCLEDDKTLLEFYVQKKFRQYKGYIKYQLYRKLMQL